MPFIRILLLASLGLNLFLAGWWMGDVFEVRRPPRLSFSERLARALPAETMARIAPAAAEVDQLLRQGFSEREQTLEQLKALSRKEPLAREEFDKLIAALAAQRARAEQVLWRRVGEVFVSLTPAERAAVTDVIFPYPREPRRR